MCGIKINKITKIIEISKYQFEIWKQQVHTIHLNELTSIELNVT